MTDPKRPGVQTGDRAPWMERIGCCLRAMDQFDTSPQWIVKHDQPGDVPFIRERPTAL